MMMHSGDTALGARLKGWTELVGDAGLDGWLVSDFRWSNPLLARLLGLGSGILTRRCFLWLPAPGRGEPRVLASAVDGQTFAGLDCPVTLYAGFDDMASRLRELLPEGGRVAMEYSEEGRLPTVSRVDAGLVEFVRAGGVAVVSSGPLISQLEVWDEWQRALHEEAARGVDGARRLALRRCEERLRAGERVAEGDLAKLITSYFAERNLTPGDGPDVAVDANSADPHYAMGGGEGAEIRPSSVLLIDLWAKVRDREDAPFADSTWMAYTGPTPPGELLRAFEVVRAARDAAIAAVDGAARAGTPLAGREVDRVARASIAKAGLAQYLVHRTGHSLGADHMHGMGTNLDDVEFPDDRPLLPYSGFTVEPGLYLPGRFGVRLEVSAILLPEGLSVTTERQDELTIFGSYSIGQED
jgi:Xaa-Pro aminopeptidase